MKKIYGLFHSIDNVKDIIEGNDYSSKTYKQISILKKLKKMTRNKQIRLFKPSFNNKEISAIKGIFKNPG